MKIVGKVVLGFIGSIFVTGLILLAIGFPYAEQAAAQLAAFVGMSGTDAPKQKETDRLSVKADQHQVVYQAQEDGGQFHQHQTKVSRQEQAAVQKKENSQAGTDKQNGQAGGGQQNRKQTAEGNELSDDGTKQAEEGSGQKEFQTVTEDYFSDALFIGDSRTVGMQQSGLLPNASYYAKVGIGIGDILSKRIVSDAGVMISVEEALLRHSFGKVYVMIGINDMSRGDVSWFTQQYQEILDAVQRTQPNAVIYIQGNIPMSYRIQDFSGALNNANLEQRNEASRGLADGRKIFYLDIEDIYADANGHLDTAYSSDGLHVGTKYYPRWVEYLMEHAVVDE